MKRVAYGCLVGTGGWLLLAVAIMLGFRYVHLPGPGE